jgi:hypothetical protein
MWVRQDDQGIARKEHRLMRSPTAAVLLALLVVIVVAFGLQLVRA